MNTTMKSLDLLKQEKEEAMTRMQKAITEGDGEKLAESWAAFSQGLHDSVLEEARALQAENDTATLNGRGVRQLTSAETKYFQATIEAFRSPTPLQALSNLDVVMPETVMESVFEDLKNNHPLLEAIRFQNTSGMIKMLVNTHSDQLAAWGTLTAEIVKELTSGFKEMDMTFHKLSAFLPISKAMLDLGPAWIDRYVREVLTEAIYLGLEQAILVGTGKDQFIGMNRQVGEGVTVTGGVYPEKTPVKITGLDPVEYGKLLAGMVKTPNGHYRTVSSVMLVVNPNDYLTKIMPATTVRGADGRYVSDVLPYPTTIIQSAHVPEGRAIAGLADRYFAGIGTAKSGKIEYSDEFRLLQDERVYITKLYGHGEPLDNNAFVYLDISGLLPTIQKVEVVNTPTNP